MRKIVSHLIVTLDGVDVFDAVAHVIVKLRDTEEVLADFFAKLAVEDAMLLGHVTYREWAEHSPSITDQPFARHINRVPKAPTTFRFEDYQKWGGYLDLSANR